ncbi:hypothetical protein E2562_027938 [Oryza meyeriana var. granulata]|uniref:Cathepsin propeptide inhibitor domain-containing protein n=1 Tax=Oryza meyeriana var. granulata TaxID=110450 RepID=A0A6G1CVD4_9ORYZ|nr:hypothetical protein E2562_027938 [Oryza meyeriana var. granulata]
MSLPLFAMRSLRRGARLLFHGRAYDAGRSNNTTMLQGSFLRVPSGELELKLLRPGNTMEVSMAPALVGKQRYATNTAGEPSCKQLTGQEEAMKTSDDDERMMGSKRLTNEEEEALKVIFQEWMNKYNRNYKDGAEKAYRFEDSWWQTEEPTLNYQQHR